MKKIISLVIVAALTAAPCLAQTKPKSRAATETPQTRAAQKAKAAAPEGATAICGDRSYSFSKSKNPCSGRGGVIQLLAE